MAKAKKICVKCVSEEVRNYLIALADDNNTKEIIEAIPICPNDTQVEFDFKKGRKPSAYSQFIGTCIKDTRATDKDLPVSEAMKTCAVIWKQKKD